MYECVVICGGGVKLAATLGSIQYAIDMNWICDSTIYIGTSMGALISIFLAAGVSTHKILYMLSTIDIYEGDKKAFINLIDKFGLFSIDYLHEQLKYNMKEHGINPDLTLLDFKKKYNKTLIFSTYNLTKNICEYISYKNYPNLSCSLAGCMSSCIPLYFIPVVYNECKYIDGALYDNFPIRYAYNTFSGMKIIGFDINTRYSQVSNILEYIYYLFCITYNNSHISDFNIKDKTNIKIIESKLLDTMFILPVETPGKQIIIYTNLYIENYNRLKQDKLKAD